MAMSANKEYEMDFPYAPKHLMHRSGSKIVSILRLTHECYRPREGYSQDIWCAKCVVQWSDTGKTSEASIQVGNLCYDGADGHGEFCDFSSAVSDYLAQHGEWRDSKPQGWYAHDRAKVRAGQA